MKIVNLESFRKLPSGTLFMKFTPNIFEELCVKGATWEYDFLYESITTELNATGSDHYHELLDNATKTDISVEMDFDCGARDGCFDDDQLFAIYEKQDVDQFIDKLERCRDIAYPDTP